MYGGYKSTQSTSTSITDELYSLDPIGWKWMRHASSGSFRYLHTAVASHGLMMVFGGNTHNDTSFRYVVFGSTGCPIYSWIGLVDLISECSIVPDSAWADGNLAEAAGQDGGIPKSK